MKTSCQEPEFWLDAADLDTAGERILLCCSTYSLVGRYGLAHSPTLPVGQKGSKVSSTLPLCQWAVVSSATGGILSHFPGSENEDWDGILTCTTGKVPRRGDNIPQLTILPKPTATIKWVQKAYFCPTLGKLCIPAKIRHWPFIRYDWPTSWEAQEEIWAETMKVLYFNHI